GRAAEELVFNQPTTGAGNDIERATQLARKMVCEWGMSEKMGPLAFGKKEEAIFLGRELSRHSDYSEETAREIDSEIRRLVISNYEKAKSIISEHRDQLERLAQALLKHESLNGEQIDQVMRGEQVIIQQQEVRRDILKEQQDEGKAVKQTPATETSF
ncbi:MAG TPA: cell division protein FtsH, partial [bacterium]|nr:cell division protein FtsH [bacterium]